MLSAACALAYALGTDDRRQLRGCSAFGVVGQDGPDFELLQRPAHDGWIANGHDLQLVRPQVRPRSLEHMLRFAVPLATMRAAAA